MYIHTSTVRVRYGETDQMGYVYYGNYAEYYEVARVEMLRSLGMDYAAMERDGVMLPVLELQCKFIKPAFYDQEISIKTTVKTLPGVRISFDYELYNPAQELINIGATTLVFFDMKTKKPCTAPKEFMDKIAAYF
ncbi:acyl-CoA thioesterase [Pedobacter sp. MC2016-14]|uniref:acyl-CoA thioesterase n=1 Tax=Pedobacter sp. MC2016-14 TaxID=2897327 RepID=UPI001E2FF216|nr:thioesterase family protein [Pedobacter sp. MC2016-14]MCD0489606.1 acyl-CoA thioesterase [Pedobacter sp. MC2016-14]